MNRARSRLVRSWRSLRNGLNSYDASLDNVGLSGSRSLPIEPICCTILNHKCKESVGSGGLTVRKAATSWVWGELNISDDKNCGFGDGSNVLRCLGGHGILGKGCISASRSRQIDRLNLWIVCGRLRAVEHQGGGWGALFDHRAAREGNVDSRGSVNSDGRK
jgi:hypothetical protein